MRHASSIILISVALIGAIAAQLLLSSLHDRRISGIIADGKATLTAPAPGRTIRT